MTLAFCLKYLLGRSIAARYEAGDHKNRAEFPPHPARIFSAIVCAFGETGCDEAMADALRWLESLPPPVLMFPAYTERKSVNFFVPVNDSRTNLPKKKTPSVEPEDDDASDDAQKADGSPPNPLAVLPEYRPRQKRSMASVSLAHDAPCVYLFWPDCDLSDSHRKALAFLAERITYIGHSSSLVDVSLVDEVPACEYMLLPDDLGNVRLRVPTEGRLDYLRRRHELFSRTHNKAHRPNAGASAGYRWMSRGMQAVKNRDWATYPAAAFREMLVLRKSDGDLLDLRSTLQVTAALRGAILRYSAVQPPPEFLSGHPPESTLAAPRSSRKPHIGFVPLANVGHRHADGAILGIGVLLPVEFGSTERNALLSALAHVRELGFAGAYHWRVESVTAESPALATLAPDNWTQLRSGDASMTWATVTPFVFDRFPNHLHGDDAFEKIAEACAWAGLPCPDEVRCIQASPHVGVPESRLFPRVRTHAGRPARFHTHLIVKFPVPVSGIVAVGAGRYMGYGFMRPTQFNQGSPRVE